jgi:hypothetical protein
LFDFEAILDSAQASIQEAKRRVELEKQQRLDAIEAKGKDEAAREAWLSKREDAVTSPRTKARRKLLRLLYKATRRQNQGYVICEWGCGQWCARGVFSDLFRTSGSRRWRQRTAATPSRWPSESPRVSRGQFRDGINQHRCVIGREKTFHEKESCAKRIMPCLLGCGCRMREEQWLEIPDDEMAFEEPRNRHDLGVPFLWRLHTMRRLQERKVVSMSISRPFLTEMLRAGSRSTSRTNAPRG